MDITVRQEVVRCVNCMQKNEFLYMSDFIYGARLVLYDEGRRYAYINLLEDEVYNDFVNEVKYVLEMHDIVLSNMKQDNIINIIFPIACDDIEGSHIDLRMNKKCKNCGAEDFEDLLAEPERIVSIEIPVVTHEHWNLQSKDEKVQSIKEMLKNENIL